MAAISDQFLRAQLEDRRQRLQTALETSAENHALAHLLEEVDSALERMEMGTFGICESCHESIEKERIIADPLVRFCLDHLKPAEQRALEQDLQLAARIQKALLPPADVKTRGWRIYYHYEPAGLVSGDYCDVIQSGDDDGGPLFLLGDVSGKGVAASMLMSHLSALFRSLATTRPPLSQLMALANRVFCEGTIAGQYATLVCGSAGRNGELRLASAGHCPALLLKHDGATAIEATGLPLGMFCSSEYSVREFKLLPGESLFLYTDGVSEMPGRSGGEYGTERLTSLLAGRNGHSPEALTAACLTDLRQFADGRPKADDLTIMVVHREA